MKLFSCPHCGGRLYFENAQCLNCGSLVLYDPDQGTFALAGDNARACTNASQCACNWAAAPDGTFCRACALNKTIPDLTIDGNRERWIRVEAAKRRAIYSLLAYGLAVGPKADGNDEIGLAFDFLADPLDGDQPTGEHVLTGHDNGLITLNVVEADSSEREKMRAEMGENYRTLLGHFRHEVGHYYWDRLIRDDAERLERFHALFGDESEDYEEALRRHYSQGAPADWETRHISAYAASHPWEDWAETFAHYLHITDTLEMVQSLDLPLGRLDTDAGDDLPAGDAGQPPPGQADGRDPEEPFARTLARWLVLSEASNSINRCMGLPDLYPFVISPVVGEKLGFVHGLLWDEAGHRAMRPAG
ncbi:MAG: putative zinc-binding metallopeptidase [Hyphomicrobiales bacterium]|nr:putative zinc-binding metallopeptidase [Hyphomicrobiales bacterium]